jgi:predicted kinase
MKQPKFIMLVGLPGSGKSTYANKLKEDLNCVVHSSDSIREELFGDIKDQSNNNLVFETLHRRVREDLLNGKNVIYDATNINSKRRKSFLYQLKKIDCYKECHFIATPYEVCVAQNNNRENSVPLAVIDKMYTTFDIPFYDEGWHQIELVYTDNNYRKAYGSWSQFIFDTLDFEQDNPHHSLTLGRHCLKCKEGVETYLTKLSKEVKNSEELLVAAALHDNGKPFVKNFLNTKGELSEFAHYYEHECVGAYNSLFYDMDINIDRLYVAALIRWHMILHFFKDWKPETQKRYVDRFSKGLYFEYTDFWLNLQILHEGDRYAH